jgi:hypothetical protein
MSKVTSAESRPNDETCPTWCADCQVLPDGGRHHLGRVEESSPGVRVQLDQVGDGPAAITISNDTDGTVTLLAIGEASRLAEMLTGLAAGADGAGT